MSLPSVMRCIEVDQPGANSRLRLAERPLPTLKSGEVLIEVAAAGVNRPDIFQRMGTYPPPPGASDLLGLEVAGRIVALSPEVAGLEIGQEVCALVAGGGYADYCVAVASLCLPYPKDLSAIEAAALPETFFTVWHNLFQRAGLADGEVLLVHGGGSGIGTTAIQLGKSFGATVYVTAGGARKCQSCLTLGADLAIDYRREDFVERVRSETHGKGVDVILDMVGGDYLARNVKCLAMDGRHVSIAFLHGPVAELNFLPVMQKRLTLTGSTMRPQSVEAKTMIAQQLREKVWPLLDEGVIKPQIYRSLDLAAAEEAHLSLDSDDHFGKVVLTLR